MYDKVVLLNNAEIHCIAGTVVLVGHEACMQNLYFSHQ